MKGIVLVNTKGTREFNNLFDAEAKKNPDIVFTSIEVMNSLFSPTTRVIFRY